MLVLALLGVGLVVLVAVAFALHPRSRRALAGSALVLRGLATDRRIPRPLRWLLVVALLPVPGPFEEIAGGIALGVIAWRYRAVLDEHRRARRGGD